LLILIMAVVATSDCSKNKAEGGAAAAEDGGAPCGKRYSSMISYLDHLKPANMISVDVLVPPDDTKTVKALPYDPKRQVLQCDLKHCWSGGRSAPFGPTFAQTLESVATGGRKSCGSIYLAMQDTLPRGQADSVLAVLNKASCNTYALVRRDLTGLPQVAPSDEMRNSLKAIVSAESGAPRVSATETFLTNVLRKHTKHCGAISQLKSAMASASGHRKFDLAMGELRSNPQGYQSCACDLPPEDDKLFFQLLTSKHLAYDMFVYGAKPVPAAVLVGKGKGKIWNDVVQGLK
jgi:hypothetical protein